MLSCVTVETSLVSHDTHRQAIHGGRCPDKQNQCVGSMIHLHGGGLKRHAAINLNLLRCCLSLSSGKVSEQLLDMSTNAFNKK